MNNLIALLLWFAFLVLSSFYVRHARHPRTRPLAAYLLFVIVFTMVAAASYFLLSVLVSVLTAPEALDNPAIGSAFLVLTFLPALFVARWTIKQPPRQAR